MVEVVIGWCFFQAFLFPLSESFYQCSIFNFISMLFLAEGQTGRPGNLPKNNAFSEIGVCFYSCSPSQDENITGNECGVAVKLIINF